MAAKRGRKKTTKKGARRSKKGAVKRASTAKRGAQKRTSLMGVVAKKPSKKTLRAHKLVAKEVGKAKMSIKKGKTVYKVGPSKKRSRKK